MPLSRNRPEFDIFICILLFLFITGCFHRCSSGSSDSREYTLFIKDRAVLVFVDFTKSLLESKRGQLIESESERETRFTTIKKSTISIISSLSYGERIRICGIHGNTNMSLPIIDEVFPKGENSRERRLAQAKKDSLIKSFPIIYDSLRKRGDSTLLNSTCIKESISQIKEFRKDLKDKYQLEIIYLSDMLEDCKNKPKIEDESDSTDILNGLKIYAILILTTTGGTSQDYSSLEDVEKDWIPFFTKYGAHQDSIDIRRNLPNSYQQNFSPE